MDIVEGPPPRPEIVQVIETPVDDSLDDMSVKEPIYSHQISDVMRQGMKLTIQHFLQQNASYYVVEGRMHSEQYDASDHIIRLGIEANSQSGYAKNTWNFLTPRNEAIRGFADNLVDEIIQNVYYILTHERLKGFLAEVALEIHVTGFADASPIQQARLWDGEDAFHESGIWLMPSKPVESNAQLGYARAVFLSHYLRQRFSKIRYYAVGEAHSLKDDRGTYRMVYVDLVLKGIRSVKGFESLVAFQ